MNEYLKKQKIFLYFIVPIFLFSLIFLIIPYIVYNTLDTTDAAAHYFSAWYTNEYLFPRLIGWNPFHYFGFPQNQFYQPLHTILTILLSYIVPLDLSFKIVTSISIIAAPFSFYYFARSFRFDKFKSSLIMLGMFALLFILGRHAPGGDIISLFNAGMAPKFLSIPILFFYLGNLKRSVEKKSYIVPSLLMSFLILSHIFTAVAGLIFTLSFLVNKFSRSRLIFFAKHLVLSFVLGGFWTVPLLLKINYTKVFFLNSRLNLQLENILLYFLLIFIIFCSYKNKELRVLTMGMFLFFIFYIIAYATRMPIHLYRFNIYFLLLIPVFIINFIKKKSNFLILIIIFCSLVILNYSSIHFRIKNELSIGDMEKLDGRVLIIGPPESPEYGSTRDTIIPMKSKNIVVKGPYSESSLNAFILIDLYKSIRNDTHYPYESEHSVKNISKSASAKIIQNQVSLLGINYLITPNDVWYPYKELVKENIVVHNGVNYSLYRISNSSLIEVLNYKPKTVKDSWYKAVREWFSSENVSKVFVNEEVPEYEGRGGEKVKILNISKTQEYIKFKVDSNKPVPILIKISEFPNWNAYLNGQPTKIYRASPYIMLIYGNGIIELKYKNTIWDYMGVIVSAFGLMLIYLKAKCKKFKCFA